MAMASILTPRNHLFEYTTNQSCKSQVDADIFVAVVRVFSPPTSDFCEMVLLIQSMGKHVPRTCCANENRFCALLRILKL
jgi:hypothetical protein